MTPFGLCNAAATLEPMNRNALRKLKWTYSLWFIDKINVFVNTFPVRSERLNHVLSNDSQAELLLNSTECHFGTSELTVLEHWVNARGINRVLKYMRRR